MGKKLSELVEATAVSASDIFHLRTIGGIDKKILSESILKSMFDGALDTYFKGQGAEELPIFEKLTLRDTGIKIGHNLRDSAGDQIIIGVGFRPSVNIFLSTDDTSIDKCFSVGFDDGTVHYCIHFIETGDEIARDLSRSIHNRKNIGNTMRGIISAFSDDGFTITWDLTGTRTTRFIYLCFP